MLHTTLHLSNVRKIIIHGHYVALRIKVIATLHTGQKSPGLRSFCDMNNTRVDITSRTIEIDVMDGTTSTIRHLLTGNICLERVELIMFSLRFQNPNIFLANFVGNSVSNCQILDTLPVLLHHDGDCEKKLVPKENP
jgi:hypothetical protein